MPAPPGDRVVIDGIAMTFTFHTAIDPDSEAHFRLNARAVPRQIDMRFRLREGSVAANGWDGLTLPSTIAMGENYSLCGSRTTPPIRIRTAGRRGWRARARLIR